MLAVPLSGSRISLASSFSLNSLLNTTQVGAPSSMVGTIVCSPLIRCGREAFSVGKTDTRSFTHCSKSEMALFMLQGKGGGIGFSFDSVSKVDLFARWPGFFGVLMAAISVSSLAMVDLHDSSKAWRSC